jgi:hypothetical protein
MKGVKTRRNASVTAKKRYLRGKKSKIKNSYFLIK